MLGCWQRFEIIVIIALTRLTCRVVSRLLWLLHCKQSHKSMFVVYVDVSCLNADIGCTQTDKYFYVCFSFGHSLGLADLKSSDCLLFTFEEVHAAWFVAIFSSSRWAVKFLILCRLVRVCRWRDVDSSCWRPAIERYLRYACAPQSAHPMRIVGIQAIIYPPLQI